MFTVACLSLPCLLSLRCVNRTGRAVANGFFDSPSSGAARREMANNYRFALLTHRLGEMGWEDAQERLEKAARGVTEMTLSGPLTNRPILERLVRRCGADLKSLTINGTIAQETVSLIQEVCISLTELSVEDSPAFKELMWMPASGRSLTTLRHTSPIVREYPPFIADCPCNRLKTLEINIDLILVQPIDMTMLNRVLASPCLEHLTLSTKRFSWFGFSKLKMCSNLRSLTLVDMWGRAHELTAVISSCKRLERLVFRESCSICSNHANELIGLVTTIIDSKTSVVFDQLTGECSTLSPWVHELTHRGMPKHRLQIRGVIMLGEDYTGFDLSRVNELLLTFVAEPDTCTGFDPRVFDQIERIDVRDSMLNPNLALTQLIERCPNLNSVTLRGNRIEDRALLELAIKAHITELELDGCHCVTSSVRELAELKLRKLSIRACSQITPEFIASVVTPNLTHLALRGDFSDALSIIRLCPNLVEAELLCSNFMISYIDVLIGLVPHLEKLTTWDCPAARLFQRECPWCQVIIWDRM